MSTPGTSSPGYTTRQWPWLRTVIVGIISNHRPHTCWALAEADVTEALAGLRERGRRVRIALSPHAWAVYCLARAAADHPGVLSYRHGSRLLTFDDADVGSAIDHRLPNGDRIPVGWIVRGAQHRSLAEINWDLRRAAKAGLPTDASARARRRLATLPAPLRWWGLRRIRTDPRVLRHHHGTIGLTNLQSPGSHAPFWALPPNLFTVTIALGSVTERMVPQRDGTVLPRKILCLGAGADHAVIDGAPLAAFAGRFIELLQSAAGIDDQLEAETKRLLAGAPARG